MGSHPQRKPCTFGPSDRSSEEAGQGPLCKRPPDPQIPNPRPLTQKRQTQDPPRRNRSPKAQTRARTRHNQTGSPKIWEPKPQDEPWPPQALNRTLVDIRFDGAWGPEIVRCLDEANATCMDTGQGNYSEQPPPEVGGRGSSFWGVHVMGIFLCAWEMGFGALATWGVGLASASLALDCSSYVSELPSILRAVGPR